MAFWPYDISIKPYVDCCSYFVPIHPETKAKMDIIKQINKTIKLNKKYDDALDSIETHHFKYNGENN